MESLSVGHYGQHFRGKIPSKYERVKLVGSFEVLVLTIDGIESKFQFEIWTKYNISTSDCCRPVITMFRMFSLVCAGCRQPIVPRAGQTKAPRIRALDRDYHLNCFKASNTNTATRAAK